MSLSAYSMFFPNLITFDDTLSVALLRKRDWPGAQTYT